MGDEVSMGAFPGIADTGGLAILKWLCMDRIRVMVVKNEQIFVATTRGEWEFSGLIRVGFDNFCFGTKHGSENVGSHIEGWRKVGIRQGKKWLWKSGFGGAQTLGFLILMA